MTGAVGAAQGKLDVALANTAPLPTPLGLLAELTHRCPLGCPYCSNPLALDAREGELDTATWVRVMHEAAALGGLQVHLSGGAPAAGGGRWGRWGGPCRRARGPRGATSWRSLPAPVRRASTPISSRQRSASPTRRQRPRAKLDPMMCRFQSRTASLW